MPKRVEVLTEPYTGEFQTGHYSDERIDRPHEPVTRHACPDPNDRTRSLIRHPSRRMHVALGKA
jgi:hypothetical protein